MADILQTKFSNSFSWVKIVVFGMQISIMVVQKSSFDNKTALVQITTWCETGDRPLPEPVMIKLSEAKWYHYATTMN